MTKRDFIQIADSLAEKVPELAIRDSVMFMPPLDRLLRGIAFEGSGLDRTSFYAWVFIMPLCVPAERRHFSFGKRIRHQGVEVWSKTALTVLSELSAAIKNQAIPFLSPIHSLLDFAEMARAFNEKNPPTLRAIAYSLARAGEILRAIDALDRLVALCDPANVRERNLIQEAQSLRSKLVENPEEAQKQLEIWESETLSNLGLAGQQQK